MQDTIAVFPECMGQLEKSGLEFREPLASRNAGNGLAFVVSALGLSPFDRKQTFHKVFPSDTILGYGCLDNLKADIRGEVRVNPMAKVGESGSYCSCNIRVGEGVVEECLKFCHML